MSQAGFVPEAAPRSSAACRGRWGWGLDRPRDMCPVTPFSWRFGQGGAAVLPGLTPSKYTKMPRRRSELGPEEGNYGWVLRI